MAFVYLIATLALASSIIATPTMASPPSACTSFVIEVPVENVRQLVPPFDPFAEDGYSATSFASMLTYRKTTDSTNSTSKFQNFTGSFNISAQYCGEGTTLQFLTHGIGFNKSYWDFRLTPNDTEYSYIYTALDGGYSTFAWDRIGCGFSSAPDPYLEVQAFIEVEILAKLTSMLRQGQLPVPVPVPEKVIHVGHSLGSVLTAGLAALPDGNELSDGVVLTGYSAIFDYNSLATAAASFHLAKTNQPIRFGNRSSGYLTWPDKFNFQYAFLEWPYFDPAVLEYAEDNKWPSTAGEFLTLKEVNINATKFTGPVLYLTGEHDIIFCGGVCDGLFGPESRALQFFSASQSVEVYMQPNTGHAINIQYNATGAYNVVQSWADRHGF